jgi:predicted Zn-dependent peptidase
MRPLKNLFVIVLLIVSLPGVLSAAGENSSLNLDVKEFFLDNGMQFLIVERHTTPQVAIRLAIRAGSALEESGKTGIAHMLEHMMFKGTKNFGTRDVEKDQQLQDQIEAAYQVILREQQKRQPDTEVIDAKREEMDALRKEVQKIYVPQVFSSQLGKNGAVGVNAFTSKDQTQYVMSVPADMTEQWFSIASEQLFEPSWREFYVEKDVVQREWAFRYVNNPNGAAWLDLNATAYTAQPYRNPIIGWRSDMEYFNTADAVAFHKKYYNPASAVCVLVGDITVADARRLAEIYFGRYPAGQRASDVVTTEPKQQGPRESVRYLKGARTPLVRIGFHGAKMGSDDFYALDVLSMVLSHGRSARLTEELILKGKAMEAWAYNPDSRYAGMFIMGGSPNDPESVQDLDAGDPKRRAAYVDACRELEELLIAQVERIKTGHVTERELGRIKKLNQRSFLKRLRENEDLASTLATLEVQVGWPYLRGYLERTAAVTAEDVRRVAEKYIRPENQTTVFVIPGGKPELPPESYTEVRSVGSAGGDVAVQPVQLINHSDYPTAEEWKHPLSFNRRPQKIEYPLAHATQVKGATVFFLPDSGVPLIDLTLMVKAGSVDVPDDRYGLAGLVSATLVRGGTQTHTPEELARVLDDDAIRIGIDVDEEYSQVHLSVMKEDWQKGLTLLREILTRPRFDPQVLAVAKQQAVASLKRQSEDAQSVSSRELMIHHFEGHPYGRDPLAAIDILPCIEPGELKAFVRQFFVPENMVVAASGDIGMDELIKGIEGLMDALPQSAAPERRIDDPLATDPVLALIHKPGQVQSQVMLALPGVKRSDPAYWALSLLMNIFGGSDSLMYKRLRDDLGLVYSAGFYQTYKWQAGMLIGYIGCKADQTARAIVESVGVMEGLHQGVPAHEFNRKQLDALNSFVFNVDSPDALAKVYASYYLRQEPLDTLSHIQERYIGADLTELGRLANQYLDPDKLRIFVVADKTTPVTRGDGSRTTLEADVRALAEKLGLPYEEIPLR